jgi:hypothetical protein
LGKEAEREAAEERDRLKAVKAAEEERKRMEVAANRAAEVGQCRLTPSNPT